MILGVSHIVLGTAALQDDVRRFGALGYDVSFVEKELPTHPAKRPFMTTSSDHQALAFCPAPIGPAIELIQYGDKLPPGGAPLQIVLQASVPEGARPVALDDATARAWSDSMGPLPQAARIAEMSSPLWFGGGAAGVGVGTIVHHVHDVRAAREFWQRLGWAAPKNAAAVEGTTWARLNFSSAIAHWRASLLLVQSEAAIAESRLDGAGFRCLSFVTSDLDTDRQVLKRAGAEASTGRMEYTINGKPLALEIFAGPDGVMLELLEVIRSAR